MKKNQFISRIQAYVNLVANEMDAECSKEQNKDLQESALYSYIQRLDRVCSDFAEQDQKDYKVSVLDIDLGDIEERVTANLCKGTNCMAQRGTDNHSEECRHEHDCVVDMDFSKLEERVMGHMTIEKKYDGGKADIARMKRQFADALSAVALSGMYGACKYGDPDGCSYKTVSNAQDRYASAGGRHDLAYAGGEHYASDSHLHHLSAKAWNALAELQLAIDSGESMIDPLWAGSYQKDWERQRDELHPHVEILDEDNS